MADITVTVPDGVVSRVLDAFAEVYGWDEGSGQTKAEFAKSQVQLFITNIVKQHESSSAAELARQTAISSVDTDITLT